MGGLGLSGELRGFERRGWSATLYFILVSVFFFLFLFFFFSFSFLSFFCLMSSDAKEHSY